MTTNIIIVRNHMYNIHLVAASLDTLVQSIGFDATALP